MKYSIIRSMFVAASALLLVGQGCVMGTHQLSNDDRARQVVGRATQKETNNMIEDGYDCRGVYIYNKADDESLDIARVTYNEENRKVEQGDAITLPALPNNGNGYIPQYYFVDQNSVEASIGFCRNGNVTAILNFADPHKVGGGFLNGRSAQEEDLCRCTTLYASLTTIKGAKHCYYDRNADKNGKDGTGYVSERVMVSPVWILRTDAGSNSELKTYKHLKKPLQAYVISAAAVNRSGENDKNRGKKRADGAMVRLIRNIVKAAIHHHCETLVLGAFGCGVFKNDARDVAGYFRQILVGEGLGRYFRNIVFPIKGGDRRIFSQHFRDDGVNIVGFN